MNSKSSGLYAHLLVHSTGNHLNLLVNCLCWLRIAGWCRCRTPTASLANSVGDEARGRGRQRGGDYFRLAATFGKGEVTSRSSTAMMPSGARDTHRSTCQNIAACSTRCAAKRSTLFWSLSDDGCCVGASRNASAFCRQP